MIGYLGVQYEDVPKITLDHTAAILAPAILENALETALLTKFVPLEKQDRQWLFAENREGPLFTFAAKIRIGHALGLYSATARDDLISIKTIRNTFAHTREHVDFTTPEVADLCDSLFVINKDIWHALAMKPSTPREQFLHAIHIYHLCLSPRKDVPENYRGYYAWYTRHVLFE
jgi:hypothetical protein